jgi:arylsulfatase
LHFFTQTSDWNKTLVESPNPADTNDSSCIGISTGLSDHHLKIIVAKEFSMQRLHMDGWLWRVAALVLLLAMVSLPVGRVVEAEPESRPNIIVMMSDDMGWSDIGCFGGEINTPNLDRLAANGLRFTQFYNTARCCPTRASLLTGLYPHQAGIGHMMEDRQHDGYRGDLNRNAVTIAEALKPAGYATYAIGKWHVTPAATPEQLKRTHNWPLARGFERFYGTIHGAGSYYDPSALVRDNQLITVANDPDYKPREYYYTDAITDHAIRFINEHPQRRQKRPFFMYVAYTAAHWPMHAPESEIAKYRGKYGRGYQHYREARMKKELSLGLIDPRWTLSPSAEDWSGIENPEWEERGMEVYAAMVDRMDQGIGRIVTKLKEQGQLDNTLIFYLQDNGGCAEQNGRKTTQANPYSSRTTNQVYGAMAPDSQQYGSTPRQTRDGRPVLMGRGVMPGPDDTYIAYGRGWANVSNTPFREYKHWMHEGGISTPLIAHWPRGIVKGRQGRLESTPGHLIDLMSTAIDVSGARYPKEFAGQPIQPMEGVSLRPAFAGRQIRREQPLFWEHEGNRAIREGKWKLVAKENQPWELYDMESDRTEMNDLATRQPNRVREMESRWTAWAARARVLPVGQWRAANR